MECGWWKRRLPSEKGLLIGCILLLLTCSALIAINIIKKHKLNLAEDAVNSVCDSKECISAAVRILESVDDTVEPCTDFYQFACGNYIKKNAVPDYHFMKSDLQTLENDVKVKIRKILETHYSKNDTKTLTKAKKLYFSCMNTSSNEDGSVETLMNLLTEDGIGEWPILKPKLNKNYIDLARRIAKLYIHGIKPFFRVFVDFEEAPPSHYFLVLGQGRGPFLETEFYLNSSNLKYTQYIQSYKDLISEIFRQLEVDESRTKQDIEDMMQFEVEFAKITQTNYESVNETQDLEDDKLNDEINISVLEKEIPEVKWRVFFDTIFDDIGLRYKSSDLIVVVESWTYLKESVKLLKRTSPRTVANYMSWRFVAKYLPNLDLNFRRLYDYFVKKVPIYEKERTFQARWRECIQVVIERFDMELASAYLKEEYDQEIEKEVSFLISSIKEAFVKSVRKQSWLDDDTKVFCEKKIATMGQEIGYPKDTLETVKLDDYYALIDITEDSFLNNTLNMDRYELFNYLRRITGVPDIQMNSIMPPLSATPFYMPYSNVLSLPASFLKVPFFTPHCFRYVNFGSLGAVIGHEITHGFDSKLLRRDVYDGKTEESTTWWPENILEKFRKKLECFKEQYSQFPMDMFGLNVNGTNTLDENVCDNSAIRQAYRAYKHFVSEHGEEPRLSGMKYSNDQVFFLKYGQAWCEVVDEDAFPQFLKKRITPGKYRANAPLMNFPEFSSVFNCPAGSPMNPVKKCTLWT